MTNATKLIESLEKFEGKIVEQNKKVDELWYFDPIDIWMKIGQIVMLEFYDMTDKSIVFGQKPDLDNMKSIRFPAIVTSVLYDDPLAPPMYKLSISNRWSSGELGGTFCIEHFPAWRYLSDDQTIPSTFMESVRSSMNEGDEYFAGLSVNSLFYVEDVSDTSRRLIYPFEKDEVKRERDIAPEEDEKRIKPLLAPSEKLECHATYDITADNGNTIKKGTKLKKKFRINSDGSVNATVKDSKGNSAKMNFDSKRDMLKSLGYSKEYIDNNS